MDDGKKPVWDVPPTQQADLAQFAEQPAEGVSAFYFTFCALRGAQGAEDYRGMITRGVERDAAREMAHTFPAACLGNLAGRGRPS